MAQSPKLIKLFILLITTILMSTACSNNSSSNKSNKAALLKESRVIAVNDFRIEIEAKTLLTWYADFKIIMPTPTVNTAEYTLFIQQQIEQGIINKGFNFQLEKHESKYQVIAFALVGEQEATLDYLDIFKLFPELVQNNDFEQGTLIVAIVDPVAKKAAWRASVKLYLDPNLEKQLRKQRIIQTVKKVLKTLPSPS